MVATTHIHYKNLKDFNIQLSSQHLESSQERITLYNQFTPLKIYEWKNLFKYFFLDGLAVKNLQAMQETHLILLKL